MRHFSDKSCRENYKSHILYFIIFSENGVVYEIWKNITCWIPKTTNTHSEYKIIIDFSLQKLLRQRASVLRHTYIACVAPPPQQFSGLACHYYLH
jgi:hypothetical protein